MSGNESYILPAALRKQLTDAVADWTHHDKVSRLWQRDASLWTNSDEARQRAVVLLRTGQGLDSGCA